MPIDPSRILYQDDHLLAINKLAGELVVKAPGKGKHLPLLDFLKKDYPGLRALHRLDFPTSGIVLFARTKAAAEKAKENSEAWKKTYCAIVAGKMEKNQGIITFPLPARTKKITVPAKTIYHVLERFRVATIVEATIQTGRQRQIRRHFAMIHHPLILDDEEGDRRMNQALHHRLGYRRLFLHAVSLELLHPITGAPLKIQAPLPRVFLEAIERLRAL